MEQEYRQKKEDEQMVLEAMHEAENVTNHHITGALYTAAAVLLRKPPYRWSAEKTMRFLNRLGEVINDINEGSLTLTDLVAEGEHYGIRVLWAANHKFIKGLSVFEEDGNGDKGKGN